MNKVLAVAYVPVLHRGYIEFLHEAKARGAEALWVIGDSVLEEHEELDYINRKDRIRAIPQVEIVKMIEALDVLPVRIVEVADLKAIDVKKIILPQEDITELVYEKYFLTAAVERITIFLRLDKSKIKEDKLPASAQVSMNEFQTKLWQDIFTEAAWSADWWRQVGAALVKEGEVLFITHNEHIPEAQLPNIEGDARSLFKKGISINYVTAAHAEVVAIAEAAKRGIATEGAELYLTDFPCPYCARLIASAGIKKLYFVKGYAVLDGDEFLKEAGVEVVQVAVEK